MDAILTDEDGRPLPRPAREDYPDTIAWMRAVWAWKDSVASIANEAFAKGFRSGIAEP